MPSDKKKKTAVAMEEEEEGGEALGVNVNYIAVEPLVRAGNAHAVARYITEQVQQATLDTAHEIESEDEEEDHDDVVDEWRSDLWRVHLIPLPPARGSLSSTIQDLLDDSTSVSSCEDALSDDDDIELARRVQDHAKRFKTKHLSIRTSRRVPLTHASVTSLVAAGQWRVRNEQDTLRLATLWVPALVLRRSLKKQ